MILFALKPLELRGFKDLGHPVSLAEQGGALDGERQRRGQLSGDSRVLGGERSRGSQHKRRQHSAISLPQ